MKLWEKGISSEKFVEEFTVGNDLLYDACLAEFDVLASIAHAAMLGSCELLSASESTLLVNELKKIYSEIKNTTFQLPKEAEDIHSYLEELLTIRLGDVGKKIHIARSRNDQVLTAIKLYLRQSIIDLIESASELIVKLCNLAEQHSNTLLPGYTHFQTAMPSSFGLWFGAYAESLIDDISLLHSAFSLVNKNPLGSAAGFGSSFPIDRMETTRLLAFEDVHYSSVYAQMTRGKTERVVAQGLSNFAATLSKFCMDVTLYLCQNFNFISFPDSLTTGSSIMPHKKNPDIFELCRAYCNRIMALPEVIALTTVNLPSGYHRDTQLLKEILFPAFDDLGRCIAMLKLALQHIVVNPNIMANPLYDYMFSVEAVNKKTLDGIPFRDAYMQVAEDIANGKFQPERNIKHSHVGSIGNLCIDDVRKRLNKVITAYNIEKIQSKLYELVK